MSKRIVIEPNQWMSVASANLAQIKYDPGMGFLWVLFHGKTGDGASEYLYVGVPSDVVEELINAESVGKYFAKNIAKKFKTMRELTHE